jgi:hypothetical protein
MAKINTYDELAQKTLALKEGDTFIVGPEDISPDMIEIFSSLIPILTVTVASSTVDDKAKTVTVTGEASVLGIDNVQTSMIFMPIDLGATSGPFSMRVNFTPPKDTQWALINDFLITNMAIGFEPYTELKVYSAYVGSDLIVGSQNALALPIRLDIPTNDEVDWSLTGDFESQPLTPDAFSSLTCGIKLSEYLPSPLDTLSKFGMSELELAFNPSKSSISYTYLVIEYASEWSILDVIHVPAGGIQLKFMVDFSDLNNSYVELEAQFEIATIPVDIGAHFSPNNFIVWGGLQEGKCLKIKDLFEYFKVTLPSCFPEIEIDRLKVLTDILSKIYSFEMQAKIDTGSLLKLDHLSAKVAVASSVVDADFSGTILIGNAAAVFIEAKYDGRGGGLVLTGTAENIPIGEVIAYWMQEFGVKDEFSDFIKGMELKKLHVTYNTSTGDFKFFCEGIIPIDDKELDISFDVALSKKDNDYIFSITGSFKIGEIVFKIDFEHLKGLDYLIAVFDPKDECTLVLRDLISQIWSGADIIPETLEIKLKDVFFVLASEKDNLGTSSTKIILGVDVGAQFDLSEVEVLGTIFEKGSDIGIDDLQALVVTKPASSGLLKSINETLSKLSESKFKILSEQLSYPGLYIVSIFNFVGFKPQIELPIVKKPSACRNELLLLKTSDSTSEASNVHWCSINKTIGPIQLRRIGIALDGNCTKFNIDISLVTTGLEIDLLGLWVGIDVSNPFGKLPAFGIHGLDVAYSQAPIVFNGGLLYVENPAEGYKWEINGQLIVKYSQYGLFADASYAQSIKDMSLSSFFAFLMVSAPIGGPPYLYVSGLAGGFGFNRNLIIPRASELSEFPLVQGVLGTGNLKSDMHADVALQKMDKYVPPKESDYWLAAGVAVGSCHIINAFVMAVGVFGVDFDLAIIGVATADIPTAESTELIAHLELALVGDFNPKHGSVGITGALTNNSYLFDPECKITGGFAYCIWSDKGDFVVSVGGYSKAFKKPEHYPTLNRLGINWKIASNLTLKGGAYYAYTPSCAMAGGELDLNFSLGSLNAWLTAHADFLMEWLPFHYDVSIGVQVGVSVTVKVWFVHKTFKLEIGADIHMWGPSFAGEAKIELWIVSFTISFGENRNKKPEKLDWDHFYKALLSNASTATSTPNEASKADETESHVNTVSIKKGLIKGIRSQNGEKDYWVIDPNKFILVTHSAIPATSAWLKNEEDNKISVDLRDSNKPIGIRPMGLKAINTEHVVTIQRKQADGTWSSIDLSHITYSAYSENLPDAIWANDELKGPSASTLLVPVGIEIASLDATYYELPSKGDVSTEVFMFVPLQVNFVWRDFVQPQNPSYIENAIEAIKASIMSEKATAVRNDVLNGLKNNGFNFTELIDLNNVAASAENMFEAEPKLFELGAKE